MPFVRLAFFLLFLLSLLHSKPEKKEWKSTFYAFPPFQMLKCMPDRFCNKLRRWGKHGLAKWRQPKTEWHRRISTNNTAVCQLYNIHNSTMYCGEKNSRMKNCFIRKHFSIEHCIQTTGIKPACFLDIKLKCRSWLWKNHVLSKVKKYTPSSPPSFHLVPF